MFKDDRVSASSFAAKLKAENLELQKKVETLQSWREENEFKVADLTEKLRGFESRKKVPLLVYKQIYNEVKDPIGEAYVEELRSVRSDGDLLFGNDSSKGEQIKDLCAIAPDVH